MYIAQWNKFPSLTSSCVAGPSHSMEWVQLGPPGTPG